ncbi:MAG: DNA-binding protein [Bacteroidetes bacterium HGW-Bacteroidetes-12]|nr:MAG: DNA-binding protein [Bacteroidetes bacterium HGW-Bacteroidetes-12]
MSEKLIIPDEVVISKIYHLRDLKVMLDSDLAELYGVETRVLNQQVKRNEDRFPEDFMFQLTKEEWENLKSQNATSSWGGRRKLPYVFTEHGVLMLSSVLNSKKAIAVNIQIMRIFTKLREMILTHKDLLIEMEELRKKVVGQDDRIEMIYKYLLQFIKEQETPRTKIGFKKEN